MSWSNDFLKRLNNSDSLDFRFKLHFLPSSQGVGSEFIIDSSTRRIQIEGSNIRINGSSIQPQSFSSTFGQFAVQIVGDWRYIQSKIRKGQFAILYAGFEGYSATQYQRLIWGNLEEVRKTNFESFEFVFGDALMSLNTRQDVRFDPSLTITGRNVSRSALFYTIGQTTTLTHNFSTSSDTQLKVSDVTIFEKDSSGNGLILVDDSAHSDPFYVQWTSKTITSSPAGYLVVTPSGPLTASYPTQSSVSVPSTIHATTTTITAAAQITEFPPHIIGKILRQGTGSTLDSLPASWGIGSDLPADLYDFSDAENQKTYIQSSLGSTYKWQLAFVSPQTEIMRLISSKASAQGQWAVLRQGRISWRGCNDDYLSAIPNKGKDLAATITDADIQSVISHDFYDPSVNAVFHQIKMIYDQDENTSSTNPQNALTLPIYNATDDRGDGLTLDSTLTRSALANGDLNRLQSWLQYIPEKIVLNCRIGLAALVAGDNILLESSLIYGVEEEQTKTIARRGMISGVDIDFTTRSAIITILFLPKRIR